MKPGRPAGFLGAPEVLFWGKVLAAPSGCWIWVGARQPFGYGTVRMDRRTLLAHRVAYTWLVGPIPDGLTLDHLCRVPRCVNPRHLQPVSGRVNTLRGLAPSAYFARRGQCARGHPWSGNNVRHLGNHRVCRACAVENSRAYRVRLAARSNL